MHGVLRASTILVRVGADYELVHSAPVLQSCSVNSSHVPKVCAGRCAALDLRVPGGEMVQGANLSDAAATGFH